MPSYKMFSPVVLQGANYVLNSKNAFVGCGTMATLIINSLLSRSPRADQSAQYPRCSAFEEH